MKRFLIALMIMILGTFAFAQDSEKSTAELYIEALFREGFNFANWEIDNVAKWETIYQWYEDGEVTEEEMITTMATYLVTVHQQISMYRQFLLNVQPMLYYEIESIKQKLEE